MSTQISISSSGGGALTVGTTPVTSGTDGRVLFQAGGVLQQDAAFFWDNTNKRLGIGATPSSSVRLDVRAQGTLSTDVAFRVRNSADSANLFNVNGDGSFSFPSRITGDTGGLGARLIFGNACVMHTQANHVNITGSRIEVDAVQTMLSTNSAQNVRFGSSSGGAPSQIMLNYYNAQIHLGGSLTDSISGTNVFSALNGTAPTVSLTDRFQLYSADRGGVAGKASAYFRTEDGTINVLGDLSGIGTSTPQARLDVIAQGALSTDIAFRVRNSADTANLFDVQGDGVTNVRTRINCGFSGMTSTGGALHVYAGNSNDFAARFYNTSGISFLNIRTTGNGCEMQLNNASGGAGVTLNGIYSNAITLADSRDIVFGTGGGTKIASATNQKFAFWNATPIVQPTTAVAAATLVGGGGTTITATDTFDGYTLQQIVKALRNTGLLA